MLSDEEYSKNSHPIMDGVEVRCPYCRHVNIVSTTKEYESMFDEMADEEDEREKERRAQEEFYNVTHFIKW
jgi:phage FluMu protein Com